MGTPKIPVMKHHRLCFSLRSMHTHAWYISSVWSFHQKISLFLEPHTLPNRREKSLAKMHSVLEHLGRYTTAHTDLALVSLGSEIEP